MVTIVLVVLALVTFTAIAGVMSEVLHSLWRKATGILMLLVAVVLAYLAITSTGLTAGVLAVVGVYFGVRGLTRYIWA